MDDDLIIGLHAQEGAEGRIGRRRLTNSNPPGDFTDAAWCGRKTRRGTPCRCPGMAHGAGALHGGLSTGPKPEEGIGVSESQCQAWPVHEFTTRAETTRASSRTVRGMARGLTPMLRSLCGKPRIGAQRHAPRMATAKCGDSPTRTDDGNSLSPVI